VAFTYRYPCPEITALLLEHKADINARNKDGLTLLHVAVNIGAPLMLEELLDIGADLNATDGNGQTPVEVASTKGYSSAESELRKKEAEDTKAKANNGNKRGRNKITFRRYLGARKRSLGECSDAGCLAKKVR
jgi:ankyrin repeat protein